MAQCRLESVCARNVLIWTLRQMMQSENSTKRRNMEAERIDVSDANFERWSKSRNSSKQSINLIHNITIFLLIISLQYLFGNKNLAWNFFSLLLCPYGAVINHRERQQNLCLGSPLSIHNRKWVNPITIVGACSKVRRGGGKGEGAFSLYRFAFLTPTSFIAVWKDSTKNAAQNPSWWNFWKFDHADHSKSSTAQRRFTTDAHLHPCVNGALERWRWGRICTKLYSTPITSGWIGNANNNTECH